MKSKSRARLSIIAIFLVLLTVIGTARAQSGSRGSISVSVTDPNGLAIVGAGLTLVDQKTNDTRTAKTLETGYYSFSGLLASTYTLTVEKAGFAAEKYDAVVVESARITDVRTKLQVGSAAAEVTVEAEAAPIVETQASAVGSNFDVKAMNDLPLSGHDATAVLGLVPGAADGIFNGMRGASQTNAVDGIIASSSRGKDGGNSTPAVTMHTENVEEVVVQTDQLDLNQGYGMANMQSYFNTRRGTEKYHGRYYGNILNDRLNTFGFNGDYSIYQEEQYFLSQGWSKSKAHNRAVTDANESRVAHSYRWLVSGDGTVPISSLKNKLFFFASYRQDKNPGNATLTPTYFSNGTLNWSANGGAGTQSNLENGIYTYLDTNNTLRSVDLFAQAKKANSALNLNLPTSVYSVIQSDLQNIDAGISKYAHSPKASTGGDTYNLSQANFSYPNSNTEYYPTVRFDYNASDALRLNLSLNYTKTDLPNAGQPPYPGPGYDAEKSSYTQTNYTAALGADWTISPTLVNQFHGGYLYFDQDTSVPTKQYLNQDLIIWQSVESITGSGQQHASPTSNFYPLISFSDAFVWQHKAHNVQYGVSGYREQDHYWNPPLGWNQYIVGALAGGDPAVNAFQSYDPSTNPNGFGLPDANSYETQVAQAFWGILAGRLTSYWNPGALNKKTGTYGYGSVTLNEVQQGLGLFIQDNWRLNSSLTINYGIRWDFTGADHDKNALYHSASPSDIWGLTGAGNQFHPGSFLNTGTPAFKLNSNAYDPWYVSPQPSVGLVWNPSADSGFLGKIAGGKNAVVRVGFALRNYTESYQNFWLYASNGGSFFGNNQWSNASGAVNNLQPYGTFAPGTYNLGDPIQAADIGYDVKSWESNVTEESLALKFGGPMGMNPHIRQPYLETWNLGFERQFGRSNAIEARYVGNHGVHEWVGYNPNEVNIFENGFLMEFKQAQANLNASIAADPNCMNTGTCSFKGSGQNMGIMTAAFAGDETQWNNGGFLYNLQNGQVGDFASTLTSNTYFCNLAGGLSGPCNTNVRMPGTGNGPYPMNTFQANGYFSGSTSGYLDALGASNYHSLQVEFRQKDFHGANFTANYTFAKNLGMRPIKGADSSNFSFITLRSPKLAYAPSDSDIRQTFHLYGTYDLPFGKGKQFLGSTRIADKVLGNWTIGTVTTWQGGLPFLLYGGNHTFNNFTDGGIELNGITLNKLRRSVGAYHNWSSGNINFIDPKVATTANLKPNTTAGTLGERAWLWGQHNFYSDASATKTIPIHERIKFTLQGEFYNVFNHTVWGTGLPYTTSTFSSQNQTNVQAIGSGFGVNGGAGGGRTVEIRANVEF